MTDEMGTPPHWTEPEAHLEGLGERFIVALEELGKGNYETGVKELQSILKVEPRLAEPHMELARFFLETSELDTAQTHAVQAVQVLESGGQWNQDVPVGVMKSLAYDILGECHRRHAEEDENLFGERETFEHHITAAKLAFLRALQLDPTNEHARSWSIGLGPVNSDEESDDADSEADD